MSVPDRLWAWFDDGRKRWTATRPIAPAEQYIKVSHMVEMLKEWIEGNAHMCDACVEGPWVIIAEEVQEFIRKLEQAE